MLGIEPLLQKMWLHENPKSLPFYSVILSILHIMLYVLLVSTGNFVSWFQVYGVKCLDVSVTVVLRNVRV